jgi:hypothetical protein
MEEGVNEQLNVLMIGFREIVRQTAVGCAERGMLLDKIWKCISSLLDSVVSQMQETILSCEERMNALNIRASRHEADILEMNQRHEQEVRNLQQSIGHKWGKRVEVLKRALIESEERAGGVEGFRHIMKMWWPKFGHYSDSVLLEMVGGEEEEAEEEEENYLLPDEALAADIKRIVDKCLVNYSLVEKDEELDEHEGMQGQAQEQADAMMKMELPGTGSGGSKERGKTVKENQSVFKNLMNVANNAKSDMEEMEKTMATKEREYKNEIRRLKQEVDGLKKRNSTLHNTLVKSTHVEPEKPPVEPEGRFRDARRESALGGRANRRTKIGEGGVSRLDRARKEGKILGPGRVQREMIRYIKQFMEWENERMEGLFVGGDGALGRCWWGFKERFRSFVRMKIMMKKPEDFWAVDEGWSTLTKSASHWSRHIEAATGKRCMDMFAKLLGVGGGKVGEDEQERLWLYMANMVHEHFSYALDDGDEALPVCKCPQRRGRGPF